MFTKFCNVSVNNIEHCVNNLGFLVTEVAVRLLVAYILKCNGIIL